VTDLTLDGLVSAGLPPTQARLFLEPLRAACARFDITTPARLGAFIGQCRVESADFTVLEENLWYTTPERLLRVFPSRVRSLEQAVTLTRNPQRLANLVYAGRLGNGDVDSGDGWRFRGRGLKQLTGRDNYADAGVALGRPYTTLPDLVSAPTDAALTAAWYWHSTKCNLLADAWNIDAITRAVNGPAMLQAGRRAQYSQDACSALSR
jgi:putative chitinase